MQHHSASGLPHSRVMETVRRLGKWAAVSGAVVVLSAACTPDTSSSGDDSDKADDIPSATMAVPPERMTPFCEAMIELSVQIDTDPPDDIDALVIETYLEIEDEVPADIEPDFAIVLAELQGEPVPSSTVAEGSVATTAADGDLSDEGYLPSDDPTARLSAYVDYTCGGSLNNPGPPDTQPIADLIPTTTEP